jgi:acetyl-CoA acetyltransferase
VPKAVDWLRSMLGELHLLQLRPENSSLTLQDLLFRSFPIVSGFKSVNRQCASSLQATTDIAISIKAGLIDMGIASGSEHMTRDYGVSTFLFLS